MQAPAKTTAARRLLYLVSEDWYFLSHRLPMARAARDAGYEVHVATRVVNGGAAITAEGFVLHPLGWRRGSMNPLHFASAVAEVRGVYRSLAPDLVHQVAFWPSVVGSLAALGLRLRRLSALAGMGFAFTSTSAKAWLVRTLLRPFLRHLLGGRHAAVLVQNPDDRAAMAAIGIEASRIFLIPGSGVDTDRLRPLPEPDGPVTMAYVGRLLDDKGLRALVTAQTLLEARGDSVRLLICGDADPANPASIPDAEIAGWRKHPSVSVLGYVADVASIWARAHIAVLPSRREGLPLSLLEAAACGRPLIATDVPGCREIARPGLNALLVPVDDAQALADAAQRLAREPATRAKFAAAGRDLVEREFSSKRVGADIVKLYDTLLTRTA
ncbi:MAG TPA: glycosyltransferase family 4 protein [Pseudolabrys sp.]|nr:glycosyltransferase family 4 protein [Pseudolabrys sp.]